jgi:hypothetical protein
VVDAHFTEELGEQNWNDAKEIIDTLIENFVEEKMGEQIATDQLLNTIYLFSREVKPDESTRESLKKIILKSLDSANDNQ